MSKFLDSGKGLKILSPMKASIKINAAQRLLLAASDDELDAIALVAQTELRARMTAVGRFAAVGMRQIEGMMRTRGYTKVTVHNGPNYYTTYKCPKTKRIFELIGWHGEVARYGDEKSIMELYDSDVSNERAVIHIGVTNGDNINPQNQQRIINEIIHYLQHES